MKIENIDVYENFNQCGAAVTFEFDGVEMYEWISRFDDFWVVERTDSALKHHFKPDCDICAIHDELDARLEELV